MKDHLGKIFAVLAVVAIGGSIVVANYVSQQANDGVVINQHIKGNPEAAVTLTEYSDFQCPACASFAPVIGDLLDQYGDQIAFEYKHFPLISIHPFAVPAAKAAEAAGQQGKFFEMHDKLFENQSIWANSANPTGFFITYAHELELDVDLFRRHMRASMIDDKVNAEFSEARELGLNGTPSFFLNGSRFQFNSIDEFMAGIEAVLGIAPADAETAVDVEPAAPAVQFGI